MDLDPVGDVNPNILMDPAINVPRPDCNGRGTSEGVGGNISAPRHKNNISKLTS